MQGDRPAIAVGVRLADDPPPRPGNRATTGPPPLNLGRIRYRDPCPAVPTHRTAPRLPARRRNCPPHPGRGTRTPTSRGPPEVVIELAMIGRWPGTRTATSG